MLKIILSLLALVPQAPVVFHAACVMNGSTQTCHVWLTGGSGSLWPAQSDNVTMSTMPATSGSMIQDGVLPAGYTIGPRGLNAPTNPVGCLRGCGTLSAPFGLTGETK